MGFTGTFRYRGGKSQLADEIIDLCPPSELFLDAFGGSAAVSVAAVRSGKFTQVVYNDKDSQLYITLTTIRDHCDELVSFLQQTPLARQTNESIYNLKHSKDPIKISAGCIIQLECTLFSPTLHNKPTNCTKKVAVRSAKSVAGGWESWKKKLANLKLLQDDLLKMFLENKHWLDFVNHYTKVAPCHAGNTNTLVFLDPPYGDTRNYNADCESEEVFDWFKEATPQTTKLLCDEVGHPSLDGFEFRQFSYKRSSKNDTYEHGLYIHDNDVRSHLKGFL